MTGDGIAAAWSEVDHAIGELERLERRLDDRTDIRLLEAALVRLLSARHLLTGHRCDREDS